MTWILLPQKKKSWFPTQFVVWLDHGTPALFLEKIVAYGSRTFWSNRCSLNENVSTLCVPDERNVVSGYLLNLCFQGQGACNPDSVPLINLIFSFAIRYTPAYASSVYVWFSYADFFWVWPSYANSFDMGFTYAELFGVWPSYANSFHLGFTYAWAYTYSFFRGEWSMCEAI